MLVGITTLGSVWEGTVTVASGADTLPVATGIVPDTFGHIVKVAIGFEPWDGAVAIVAEFTDV